MANIYVRRDPHGISPPLHFAISDSANLGMWMQQNVPADSGLNCEVSLNGQIVASTATMDPDRCNAAIDIEIGLFDTVEIRFRPQGIETIALIAIVAIGATFLIRSMIPKPSLPSADDDPRDNNNQLNAASNGFRPRLAIPDMSGQSVSFPDFIQPPYYVYENNQRVFREIFCFTVGECSVEDLKESETLLTDIPGYHFEIFGPGETPPNLINVRTAPSSVDVDLLSSDDQTKTVYINDYHGAQVTLSGLLSLPINIPESIELTVGSLINFEVQYLSDGLIVVQSGTGVEVLGISGGDLLLDFAFTESGNVVYGYITNQQFAFLAPWLTLEGDAIAKIWFHLVMPQGIRNGTGTTATVSAVVEAQQIDEDGNAVGAVISMGASFVGNTQSAQRQTFELNQNYGMTPGRYKARARRITASLGDNALDLLTLEGIASVTPYTADFGSVTLLDLTRSSSQRVSRGSSNKINALITRKLRIFNPDTGIYGTDYVATRRFCDYAFYLLHERMGVPIEQINTTELFGIFENLTDPQLGYFDYSFSDRNVSARERLEACCNVARVRFWNEGLLWSFNRIEEKPFKTLMFNRRNLKAGTANFTQQFRRPADHDSVTVIYVDPIKNSEKRVSRRINSAGEIVPGEGIRSNEIKLNGCRNDVQALNRCELEVRRLIYENVRVTDTALNDGQLARLGARVDWIDIYDSDLFDGEVLAVTADTYSISERFIAVEGVEYWVYITDINGTPSNSVRCYPVPGEPFKFTATGLTGAFVAGGELQLGSRYVIASNNDLNASAFTVVGRGRPNERGECEIELAEYHPEMFEAD